MKIVVKRIYHEHPLRDTFQMANQRRSDGVVLYSLSCLGEPTTSPKFGRSPTKFASMLTWLDAPFRLGACPADFNGIRNKSKSVYGSPNAGESDPFGEPAESYCGLY